MFILFAFIFRPVFSAAGCFEHDSIAQQQGTEAAEGVLRASRGRLYPPWSLMLATFLAQGCFPLRFEASDVNTWKWDFESRSGEFYSKAAAINVKRA
jgi:hypothetical protein